MKKLNNKGFSLVELVIATAILSVVAVTVGMMMTSGTNMYSGVQKKANVLFKAQVGTAQLEQILSDADSEDGICLGTTASGYKALYIIDKKIDPAEGEPAGILTTIYHNTLDNTLYQKEDTIEVATGGAASVTSDNDAVPFCYNITDIDFSVLADKDNTKNDGIDYIYSVKFTPTISKNDLDYDRNTVVALRNKPATAEAANGATALDNLMQILWR